MSGARALAGGSSRRWSVVCDFDGTIAPTDVTDTLLLRFAQPGWRELEAAWQAGRISARSCLAGQIALLDCSRDELDRHVAGIAVDPRFAAFVDAVRSEGGTIAIASDGLDGVIAALLARESLAGLDVRASRLVQVAPRQWRVAFPHARAQCASGAATCKCACLREAGRPALLVGDGASDFCAAASADATFARSTLVDHCAALGLPHRPIAGFADALVAWRELGTGAAAAAPQREAVA